MTGHHPSMFKTFTIYFLTPALLTAFTGAKYLPIRQVSRGGNEYEICIHLLWLRSELHIVQSCMNY